MKSMKPEIHAEGSTTTETHPAFGVARVSRVSGHRNLFQSEFPHQHYIEMEILTAKRDRDLHQDWVHSQQSVCRIAFSEHQWAQFVASPGMGMGVPCTLTRVHGESVPGIEREAGKGEVFESELKAVLSEAMANIAQLEASIAEIKASKASKDGLQAKLNKVRRAISSSVPFIEKSFRESMEKSVVEAQSEVSAFAGEVQRQMGLQGMKDGGLLKALGLQTRPEGGDK